MLFSCISSSAIEDIPTNALYLDSKQQQHRRRGSLFGFSRNSSTSMSQRKQMPSPVESPFAATLNNAQAPARRQSRRMSLQAPFFSSEQTTPPATALTDTETAVKKRRVSKVAIGRPEGFRHEAHLGADGLVTPTGKLSEDDPNWDVEAWRANLEKTFKPVPPTPGSPNSQYSQAARPKGPRSSLSSSANRPGSAPGRSSLTSLVSDNMTTETGLMIATPTTSATSLSRSLSDKVSSSPPPSFATGMGIMPASAGPTTVFFNTEGSAALNRSMSANASLGGSTGAGPGKAARVRRKPVPQPLPIIDAEVSPFPTIVAGHKEPERMIPFQEPPPNGQQPKKELVPLLGVPGDDAHYVTKTTKARWDGAMAEIAKALRDPVSA